MKRSTLKFFLSMAAVTGLVGSASGDLLYTFSSAPPYDSGGTVPGGKLVWDSTYNALRHDVTGSGQGGWTLGGSDNSQIDWNWPAQTVMETMDDWGVSHPGMAFVSFDLVLNDASWNWADGAGWGLQFNIAGNSGGSQNWTQVGLPGSFAVFQNGVYHFKVTFAQLGWGEGGTADNWYQLYFGSNSGSSDGIGYFIDNLYIVPEPGTLALAGLGAASLLIFRRRK